MVSDIDLRCFVYNGYGKDFVKKQKMSPDAWLQLAYQLTFYRYLKTPNIECINQDTFIIFNC